MLTCSECILSKVTHDTCCSGRLRLLQLNNDLFQKISFKVGQSVCVDLNLTSSDIVDIKPGNMEELTEVITAAEFHPNQCNTFVYSSSKGTIRMCDMRASALCDKHAKRESESFVLCVCWGAVLMYSIDNETTDLDVKYCLPFSPFKKGTINILKYSLFAELCLCFWG